MWAGERAQQPPGPGLQLDAHDGGKVLGVLGRDSPPGLVADVVGWVRTGDPQVSGTLLTTSPVRALDTRDRGKALAPGAEAWFEVPGLLGLPWEAVAAAVLTVTVTPFGRLPEAVRAALEAEAAAVARTRGHASASLTVEPVA